MNYHLKVTANSAGIMISKRKRSADASGSKMPRPKQPCPLAESALQTVAEIVKNTGKQMIASVCTAASNRNLSIHNDQKMESLCKFLQNDIPYVFADRVTSSVLCAIAEIVKKTECMSYLFTWNGDPQCRSIIERMISAAVHSHIQVMDFTKWPKFMWPTLCKKLHLLTSLNILKLHSVSACDMEMKTLVEQDICMLGKLIMFVYQGGCSDQILVQLGKYCTKLQYLDVSLSSGVTDASISSLMKLQSLRKLNVSCTALSEEGCYKIVTGLSNLESYACSKLSKPHIIVASCPNLSHVSLSYVTCDLAILSQLKSLRELSLCRCNCLTTNLNSLLEARGYDLISLNLKYVWNVDVVAITNLCTRLKMMSWEVYTFNSDSALTASDSLPHFDVLEHLDITNFSPLYISFHPFHYINIKVLKLHFFGDICDYVIQDAVSNNYLKHVQELRLYNCGTLSMNTVRLLLRHCDCLKVLGGLATWCGVSARELEAFKFQLKKNNVDVLIE